MMKVLEGDEDERMQYGAHVDDFEVGVKQPGWCTGNQQQEDKAEGTDSQPNENSPTDSEHDKLKLASAMNQLTLNTGTSNCEALAKGMNDEQTIASGAGNHQPSHQLAGSGSGVNIKRKQSPASGVISVDNQEKVVMGISNQQRVPSGMSNKPVFHSGQARQQTNGLGLANRQAINSLSHRKNVSSTMLVQVMQPLVDRDKILQLQTLHQTFKRNEITKKAFVRRMISIVGVQKLKMAVYKLQQQAKELTQVPRNLEVAALKKPRYALRQLVVNQRGSWIANSMMSAPMAEMPNNPPLQQNAFQFYTGIGKEQRNLVPLPMTYAKSEAVENVNPGNSRNDGFEMQFSKLGVSSSTSQMDNNISGVPGWIEWEGYAPSHDEKRLLKEKLEQMGRVIAERELELAECKAERDLLVDKNLVLKQELEDEKMFGSSNK